MSGQPWREPLAVDLVAERGGAMHSGIDITV